MIRVLEISREDLLDGLRGTIEETVRETSQKTGLILFGSRSVDINGLDIFGRIQSGVIRLPEPGSDVDLFYVDFEGERESCVWVESLFELPQHQSYAYKPSETQRVLFTKVDDFLRGSGIRRHPILYNVARRQLSLALENLSYRRLIMDSRCEFFLKCKDSVYVGSEEEEVNMIIEELKNKTIENSYC